MPIRQGQADCAGFEQPEAGKDTSVAKTSAVDEKSSRNWREFRHEAYNLIAGRG
jgi:hypothetical protein